MTKEKKQEVRKKNFIIVRLFIWCDAVMIDIAIGMCFMRALYTKMMIRGDLAEF